MASHGSAWPETHPLVQLLSGFIIVVDELLWRQFTRPLVQMVVDHDAHTGVMEKSAAHPAWKTI
jgi:hypothetical protein